MGQFIDQDILEDVDQARLNDIIQNIEILRDQFCHDHDIESMKSMTQQEYSGLLMFIQMSYMRPTKCLYKYTPTSSHNGNITLMYDDHLLSCVCEYYILMSMSYNKIINPMGFSLLTGVDLDTLKRWEGLESQRPEAYGIAKRLRSAYENSLENGAQSGKNPVGYIATLNHRFGWSQESRPSLTVNINRSQSDIMSTYNRNLIDENSDKP